MNELIAQLAEQAAQATAAEPNEVNLEVEAGDVKFQIPGNFIEKFAELIVRECMGIVEAQKDCLSENFMNWSEQDFGYSMAVNDSVDMIREHLGVEQ
jgi:hypothetical protein